MRAVFQRVKRAAVDILDEPRRRSGEIGAGAMILLAVENSDTDEDAEWLASKMAHLRVFEDAEGKMNLSLIDVGGRALVVSQFTLYGNLRKGTRRLSTGRPVPKYPYRCTKSSSNVSNANWAEKSSAAYSAQ